MSDFNETSDLLDAAIQQATEAERDRMKERAHAVTVGDEWPDDILNPPGLVGEVARWIRDSSGMLQPKFALAAALTTCGALLGRGVKDWTGQRTNLYALAVGETSAGKNDPIRCVQRLLFALQRGRLLAGEVTSDTALEWMLDALPSRLLLIDEVGHYLGSVKGAGQSNGHLKTVMPALTKCWSAANGAFQGKARGRDSNGKWTPPKTIVAPHVAVYGATVPGRLFDAMTGDDFADGSIPRFLSFISTTRPSFNPKPDISAPDELQGRILAVLRGFGLSERLFGDAESEDDDDDDEGSRWPTPICFAEDAEAKRTFGDFEAEKVGNLRRADRGDLPLYLWGKAVENARRVALVVAAMRDPQGRAVVGSDAWYAVSLVRLAVGDMVNHVRENVAATQGERDKRDLLRVIRRAGECGVTQSDLTRATRHIRRSYRDDAIDDLLEGGEIEEFSTPGTGSKTVTHYRIPAANT